MRVGRRGRGLLLGGVSAGAGATLRLGPIVEAAQRLPSSGCQGCLRARTRRSTSPRPCVVDQLRSPTEQRQCCSSFCSATNCASAKRAKLQPARSRCYHQLVPGRCQTVRVFYCVKTGFPCQSQRVANWFSCRHARDVFSESLLQQAGARAIKLQRWAAAPSRGRRPLKAAKRRPAEGRCPRFAAAAIRKLWSDGLGTRSSDRAVLLRVNASAALSGRPAAAFRATSTARHPCSACRRWAVNVCNVSVSRLPGWRRDSPPTRLLWTTRWS